MDSRDFSEGLKSPKKEYRFNVVDGVLILIILAAAAALIYILAGNNLFSGGAKTEILYTIEIPLIKNEFVSAVNQTQQGTQITDSVRSYNLGEIQSVKVDAAFTNSTDMTKGVIEQKPYPDYSKVTITVKAQSTKGPGGYSVNGKIIMVGEMVDFRTPYFVSYGNCISVQEITD
ncbi:MAG: DUF4330 family protein [Oscillospiraceae bacterium]|nr:DUF4330 family protein [Oscillospiraceae bacterium]